MMTFLLFIGIAFVLTRSFSNTLFDTFENNTIINSTNGVYGVLEDSKDMTNRLDYLSLVVYVGFIIGLVVTAWFIDISPLFMVLYIMASIVLMIVSGILAYVWQQIALFKIFADQMSAFPLTNFILSNLPIFVLVAVAISLVVTYAKSRGQQ